MIVRMDLQNREKPNLPSAVFSKFELYLERHGLPTENIIASPDEQVRIMQALPDFLDSLPIEIKRNARYLSKFIAGSAVGQLTSWSLRRLPRAL